MMRQLHIIQAGIKNGDLEWLQRAAKQNLSTQEWTVPKRVRTGDEVIFFIRSYGFFATGVIQSDAKPRKGWKNRYGAAVGGVKLIEPAISLASIRKWIPSLLWAIYPRSITTPSPEIADEIRELIQDRRRNGIADLDEGLLPEANIDELRKSALLNARSAVTPKERKAVYRFRSRAIHLYVLRRADGRCEGCRKAAPFDKADGSAYLEPHHTTCLADDGPDHPAKVIALCPNCHRRAHYAKDREKFNAGLIKRLSELEPE